MLDLDALEALLGKRGDSEDDWNRCQSWLLWAAPALIAELRELRAYLDEVEANKPTVQALLDCGEASRSEIARVIERFGDSEEEM